MRNQWYGDPDDHMKWTSLIYLAEQHNITQIVQIAMDPNPPTPITSIPGMGQEAERMQDIAPQVSRYLHETKSFSRITNLGVPYGIEISTWQGSFATATRTNYRNELLQLIANTPEPTIWFFDPDTGIEPDTPNKNHVLISDLRESFQALPTNHVLACYQHNTQHEDWRVTKRQDFANALKVNLEQTIMFPSTDRGQVIILAAQKSTEEATSIDPAKRS